MGVAPPEVDEDFDFEQTLRDIHVELADLNQEAAALAAKIQKNSRSLVYEWRTSQANGDLATFFRAHAPYQQAQSMDGDIPGHFVIKESPAYTDELLKAAGGPGCRHGRYGTLGEVFPYRYTTIGP